uniref:RAD54 like 2 n=1 Tax=Gadus morhua TaxID=8049 RepID=A0A8C5AMN0_GADMO
PPPSLPPPPLPLRPSPPSVERFGSGGGLGCVLAHSMGLGKTLQVISFIDVLLRHTPAHTVLAIVPVNTLQNWLSEFNMWVPPPEALPPDSDPSLLTPRAFKVHILNDEHKTMAARAKVVGEWASEGGVLLMGYEAYRLLSLRKGLVAARKRKGKKGGGAARLVDLDEEDRQQELMRGVEQALSWPGPDVVVCDEGHRIKNCHASTSQALKNIRTRRRVVLTGYPLQNNLIEYWCMVDFVRPDFLGTRQEFSNMFERPILNGQCVDSTAQDLQLMRYRSHVLHSLLAGFVQRRGHDVLRDQLPSKEEHVILVRLSPLQRVLYTEFMNRFTEAGNSGWLSLNPLKAFSVCCKIWNHPDILYEALKKENPANEQDLDMDDIASARCHNPANPKGRPTENPIPIGGLSLTQLQEKANQVITYEWAKELMADYVPGLLENSAKMLLLFHLIEESVRKGDKMLVFSQSLSTLTVIEDFLAKRPVPPSSKSSGSEGTNQNWVRNLNYYRLDGSTTASERERLINQFNEPSNTSAWVFLLSTRAGCLGVNLIGANRVVVFDASWNPCHDAQAVCRVYRYGQRKPCHIYRLVCDYTLERKIYDRQISKQSMSDRVVDDLNPVLNFTRREVESLLHFVGEEPEPARLQLQPRDAMEDVLRKVLHIYPHLITKHPFPHESLLMDRRETKLSAAEKKAARKGYEEEKRSSVPYTRPSYAHYYPASDQSLANIPAFSQRNWRPPPRMEEKPVANVQTVQSTPTPTMPCQAPADTTASDPSEGSLGGFPINYLHKAGVFVQKIVTTTDIVIPGTNSSANVQARIGAGESIHVIRGTKGAYIRTGDGRIYAIRAANKLKGAEDLSTSQGKGRSLKWRGSEIMWSRPRIRSLQTGDLVAWFPPVSPDGQDIISELQRYAVGPGLRANEPAVGTTGPQEMAAKEAKTNDNNGVLATTKVSMLNHHSNASLANAQPSMDAFTGQDLRTSSKRKTTTPPLDKRASQLPVPDKHSSASLAPQGFPVSGGYGIPPLSLNPTMLSGSMGHPFLMGTNSPFPPPYFQHLLGQMGEPCMMYPEKFGSVSSSPSVEMDTSSVSALPPFMMNPSVAGMAGLLPPGYPLSYTQSLASLYPGAMHPDGLPGSAATPGPAGSSFLSKYPPGSASSSSSSSPSPSSPSAHFSSRRGTVLVKNGGNLSATGSSEDDDDNDVIEVIGQ